MCNVLNNDKLINIRNKFLSCVPVHEIVLKDFLASISWEQQANLLQQTLNNNLVQNYPIKNSYQKSFLKTVIDILEKNSIEIHDSLYDTYCNVLICDDTEKYYYKHYIVNEKVVSLKENKNFISEGTTGLCSWQASLALSQWCINNQDILANKKILELGSGVGLVGLTILQHCQSEEIILSDCHPKVLSILSENVNLNTKVTQKNSDCEKFDSFAKNSPVSSVNTVKPVDSARLTVKLDSDSDKFSVFSTVKNGTIIRVVDLAWEEVQRNKCCELFFPDFILAADVVYDNSVFEALCGAVKYFLERNTKTKVVFSCTERNSETLREFLKLLESNNLKITNIETPEPKDYFWSTVVPIRFFLVTAL